MTNTKKICATCGEYYSGKYCSCQKKTTSTGWEKLPCDICKDPAFNVLGAIKGDGGYYHGGKVLCSSCYSSEYEKAYEFRATPEQTARFLILSGSESVVWDKASDGMKQYAINYAKTNGIPDKDKSDYGLSKICQLI